ncbi:protein root UVB sensitive 5 isoform X2 [Morus notabilis]|uniref:protein root UVB sensitive 5 isoform X2 n=1 Tax=Morus notabilis TaxID=981085 RepID=UPI000CED5048|nr:protein root UVB sensitive 5 isoform X2 [Morus notabilis]
MASSLQLPTSAFELSTRICRRRRTIRRPQSNLQNGGENRPHRRRCDEDENVILVERYGNGTAKRFVVDDDLQLRTFLEEHSHRPISKNSERSEFSNTFLDWIPDIIRDFVLPAGFPGSVSDDYLQYMLLQFPTNVTAWICHTLVTSSLLKAVGVGLFSGSTAAASAAAIRWVSKDGIGAVGRLFIGGRFGNLFDDDPKQWRLYADFIGSAGSIFDLATPLYPAYFLPLASIGNLAKAVARGLKDPSFRVIQNHFAISGNLGEVAAKEEVWEVAAQLLGLALGILILDTPSLVRAYPVLALTWFGMRLLHLWLRYQSLSVLQFNIINLKRARILVKSHVLHSTVPGYVDCNKEENILLWQRFMKPRIVFGVPLEEFMGAVAERSVSTLKSLLKLYEKEKYILVVNQQERDFEVFVSFKVGASSVSVLRSVWQTYWLHENWNRQDNALDQIARSLSKMEDSYEDFIQQLNQTGWDINEIKLKVPKEVLIYQMDPV